MIDLKNRSREQRVYQYPRDVRAGDVCPTTMDVVRSRRSDKTGEVQLSTKNITVGGVLTLPPLGELKGLPDALLNHPVLKRDIEARLVIVKSYANPTTGASVARIALKKA